MSVVCKEVLGASGFIISTGVCIEIRTGIKADVEVPYNPILQQPSPSPPSNLHLSEPVPFQVFKNDQPWLWNNY